MVYETGVNMTGLVELMQYTNRVTNYGGKEIFVIMLLITVYVIPLIYMMLRESKWDEASMVAGFFATITAIILRVTEITIQDKYIFFAIATIIVPLVIIFLKDRST